MAYFFFLIGPAGCGKSTIAKKIKKKLNIHFFEGDDFHSLKNINKMREGSSLNFKDRLPWLIRINKKLRKYNHNNKLHIIACSALKISYRKILRQDLDNTFFLYLYCNKKELVKRNLNRSHFFPSSLIGDQIKNFENSKDLIKINAKQNIVNVQKIIIKKIRLIVKIK